MGAKEANKEKKNQENIDKTPINNIEKDGIENKCFTQNAIENQPKSNKKKSTQSGQTSNISYISYLSNDIVADAGNDNRSISSSMRVIKVFVCVDVFHHIVDVTIRYASKSIINIMFEVFANPLNLDSLLSQFQQNPSKFDETTGIDIVVYTDEEYFQAMSPINPTLNTYTSRTSTRTVFTNRMFNEAWETSFYQVKHTNIFPHNIRMFLSLPVLSNWYINRKDEVNDVARRRPM